VSEIGLTPPTDTSDLAVIGAHGGFSGEPDAGDADSNENPAVAAAKDDSPLDLALELEEDSVIEEAAAPAAASTGLGGSRASADLLGEADKLVDEDGDIGPRITRGIGLTPMPKQGTPATGGSGSGGGSGGSGGGGGAAPGATLFERMANLSRGGKTAQEDEADEEDDSAALSIPRFLGRQNNQ